MRPPCPNPVNARGVIIGGPALLICLPLMAKDEAELTAQAKELVLLGPDLLEWRIDALDRARDVESCLDALSILRQTIDCLPLIFTCRMVEEGGVGSLSRDQRLELILASIETGLMDLVDIELQNNAEFIRAVTRACRKKGVKLILSFHDIEKTPDQDVIMAHLNRAQDLGADVAKAAVMAQTPRGCPDPAQRHPDGQDPNPSNSPDHHGHGAPWPDDPPWRRAFWVRHHLCRGQKRLRAGPGFHSSPSAGHGGAV